MNIKKTAKYAAIITTATALTISSALSQQLIQKKPPQLFIRGKTTSTRKIISSSLRLQGFLKKENNKNNIFAIEKGVKTHNNDVNIERQKKSYSYYNSGTLNILKESVIDAIIIVGISIGLAELRKATIRYISRWLDKVYSSGKH